MKINGAWTRAVALVAAVLLLAAACGSDDGGDDTETGDGDASPTATDEEAAATEEATESPTEDATEAATEVATEEPNEEPTDVALTASFRGVTEDTITLGISMLDFEFLVSSGLSEQGWGDQQLVWETFIADLNAKGGVNGRQIVPVFDKYSPVGVTEAEAACLRMTEDNEVFAVLGGFLGPAAPATTCIVGPQETILVGSGQTAERMAEATVPWIQSASLRERRLDIFIELLDREGLLDGVNLAIVGGPAAEAEYEAAPAILAEYGVEPSVVAFNSATSGELIDEDIQWEPIAEKIRTEGADTVLLIGSTQGGVRNIAKNGLDVQIWALEADGLTNPGASVNPADMEGAITVGGLADLEAWEEPLVEECREIFTAANPDIEVLGPADIESGEEQWFNPIMAYCRWLQLFTMVATEAGADLTQDSFAAAAATFDQFALPGIPLPSLGPEKFDASDSFRLSVFDNSVSDTGDLVPLTDIQDGTP